MFCCYQKQECRNRSFNANVSQCTYENIHFKFNKHEKTSEKSHVHKYLKSLLNTWLIDSWHRLRPQALWNIMLRALGNFAKSFLADWRSVRMDRKLQRTASIWCLQTDSSLNSSWVTQELPWLSPRAYEPCQLWDRCVALQITSDQVNLELVESNDLAETSQRCWMQSN